MKKLLSFLLAASMLLGVSTTAFASMYDGEYTYITEGETAECEFDYYQNSQFTVKIPVQISNIVWNYYTFEASEMNILDTEQVCVYLEGNQGVEMFNERGDKITLFLEGDADNGALAVFNAGYLTASSQMMGSISGMAYAGNYSGTATFRVALEQK